MSADAQGGHQLHRHFYCGRSPSPPCPSLVLSEAAEGEFPVISPFPWPVSRAWQTRGDTNGTGQPLGSQRPEWDPRDGRGQPRCAAPSVAHRGTHRKAQTPGTAKAGGHRAAEAVLKPSCPAELGGPGPAGGMTGRQMHMKNPSLNWARISSYCDRQWSCF